jgi:hypothetical protein
MKNQLFLVIFMLLTTFSMTTAKTHEDGMPVIMTEKVTNPSGTHGNPPKSPEATLLVYQDGSTFYFEASLAGCAVTLLSNNVVVYSDVVGTDGIVTLPASLTGTFELCITIDSQVFSAVIEL